MYEIIKQIAKNAYKIRYKSQGHWVVGFIVEPKGKGKAPVIIYNRGGSNDFAMITEEVVKTRLQKFASWGYIVFASQYSGNDGGEGKDEMGGSDLADVLNLKKLIETHPRADARRIGMYGISRGGMMTYMALRKVKWIKAVATIAGMSDLVSMETFRLEMKGHFKRMFGGSKKEKIKRSAAYWAEEIKTPLLLQHNIFDPKVDIKDSLKVWAKAKNARLEIYKGSSHGIKEYRNDVDKKMRAWFKKYLK